MTVLSKIWKIAKYILIFLATKAISYEMMIIIVAATDIEVTMAVSRFLSHAPNIVGLLAAYGVSRLGAKPGDNQNHETEHDECTNPDEDVNELIAQEESTFTVIKEEISCWNWQMVVGGLICFWGFCDLFSSFLFAILQIVLGIGILSIGMTKYKEKQEMQELALKRKILNAAAKAAPAEEKAVPAPALKPAAKQKSDSERVKSKTYKVAGVTHYAKNIESLGLENEDYFKSKRELIDEDLIGERVWKYQFYPEKVELVPEPENPEDPNAIKVIVDDEHVGYIKRGSCSHVQKLLQENAIAGIDCTIGGGPYKFISEEYDDEKDKEFYILEKDETSLFVHLQIYEK